MLDRIAQMHNVLLLLAVMALSLGAVEPCSAETADGPSVWDYDTRGIKMADVKKRVTKRNWHKDTPTAEMARAYNSLLVKAAFAEEPLRGLERKGFYLRSQ